jgi:hypothetical protein
MDGERIDFALRSRCPQFIGVFASDRLPIHLPSRRPLLLVANTMPHKHKGEHWVAFCFNNSTGEYFDSLGEPPPPRFRRYLDRFCNTWIHNGGQLQSVLSQFCGHYCIFYCLYRALDYSFKQILNCFTSDTTLNDYIAHNFVCSSIL